MTRRPCPATTAPGHRPNAHPGGVPVGLRHAGAVLLLAALGVVMPMPASWAATRVAEPASAASGAGKAAAPASTPSPTSPHAGSTMRTPRAAPAASAQAASGAPTAAKRKPSAPAGPLVDINSASRTDLMKLPGIGAAEADAIVAGRPYLTKADLATSKVLPTGVYLSLRRSIVALPAAKPGASTAGKPGTSQPTAAAPGASRKP